MSSSRRRFPCMRMACRSSSLKTFPILASCSATSSTPSSLLLTSSRTSSPSTNSKIGYSRSTGENFRNRTCFTYCVIAAISLHSYDRQGNFGTFTSGFVDDQQPPCSVSLQLLIGVQEFNTVNGPVRGHIHNQLVTYSYSFDVSALFLKADIRDVVAGIVRQSHSTISCLKAQK